MVVILHPGSSEWRCHEAPHEERGSGARQWRRGGAMGGAGPLPYWGRNAFLSVPDGPRRARPKGGPIIPPRRLPALHPLASRGKEKGEGRARVHKNRAGGALAVRNLPAKK